MRYSPEPRDATNVECKRCNESKFQADSIYFSANKFKVGHFSKDCPTGGGFGCRNCGQVCVSFACLLEVVAD